MWGTVSGGIFTTLQSENLKNLTKGEGFFTNENVFKNLKERGLPNDEILDYFGFEGSYQKIKGGGGEYVEGNDYLGSANPITGEISYGDLAFDSYDKLHSVYVKERFHSFRVKNGIPMAIQDDLGIKGMGLKYAPEESLGFIHAYKNFGLYRGSQQNFLSNIQAYQAKMFDINKFYYRKWWHFIYRIPRRY
jgi:hypothetical protein